MATAEERLPLLKSGNLTGNRLDNQLVDKLASLKDDE